MIPCPVSIRGRIFPSQKAAAKAFGLGPSTISQALRRNGHCNTVGTHQGRRGNTNAISRPVVLFGKRFRSIKAAAASMGVSRASIRRYLHDPASYAHIGERIYQAMLMADAKGIRRKSLDQQGTLADYALHSTWN